MLSTLVHAFADYDTMRRHRGFFEEIEFPKSVTSMDVFAFISKMGAAVLCASMPRSRPINRVFYKTGVAWAPPSSAFGPASSPSPHVVGDVAHDNLHPLDMNGRLAVSSTAQSLVLVPVYCRDHCVGFVRLATAEPESVDVRHYSLPDSPSPDAWALIDSTAIAHLIGRIYAERSSIGGAWHEEARLEFGELLGLLCSGFEAGFGVAFTRSFTTGTIEFLAASNRDVSSIWEGFSYNIAHDTHMCAMVARAAQSVCIRRFPDELQDNPAHKAFVAWKPDSIYSSITKHLGKPHIYIGIPMRVDDNVIGVIGLIGKANAGEREVEHYFAFVRSAMSEFGRSLDKFRRSSASRALFIGEALPVVAEEADSIGEFSTAFLGELLKATWPGVEFEVRVLAASQLEGTGRLRHFHGLASPVLRCLAKKSIQRQTPLILDVPMRRDSVDKGVLLAPLATPDGDLGEHGGCIVVFGPLELLASRSFLNAVWQFLATVRPALSLAQLRMVGLRKVTAHDYLQRHYDMMWAIVHDFKGVMAEVIGERSDLRALLSNPDIPLRELRTLSIKAVDRIFKGFSSIVQRAKRESDRTRIRQMREVKLGDVVGEALREAGTFVPASCVIQMDGDLGIAITTYESDLKRCLVQLMVNSLQALMASEVSDPKLAIRAELKDQTKRRPVMISIEDNAIAKGRLVKVKNAMNSDQPV